MEQNKEVEAKKIEVAPEWAFVVVKEEGEIRVQRLEGVNTADIDDMMDACNKITRDLNNQQIAALVGNALMHAAQAQPAVMKATPADLKNLRPRR